MGVHWVNWGRLADDLLDPARPQILTYVEVDGRPVLAGFGYGVILDPGQSPPAEPPGAVWHDHAGTIEQEILGGSHATDPTLPRVAVLHAWVGIDNPDGPFAADNWALPWARLGLSAPQSAPHDATRSTSLATVGVAWYLRLLRTEADLGKHEERRVEPVLARAGKRAAWRLASLPRGATPSPAMLADLGAMWEETWMEIARILPRVKRSAIERVAER